LQRNAVLRGRDTYDYSFVDWLYGPTSLFPQDEPEMMRTIPLGDVDPEQIERLSPAAT
jgi:salicylate hydroxylase